MHKFISKEERAAIKSKDRLGRCVDGEEEPIRRLVTATYAAYECPTIWLTIFEDDSDMINRFDEERIRLGKIR